MMELVIAIYLHSVLVGVIHEGPFRQQEDVCMKRGDQIADTLIKHLKPQFKKKLKLHLECSELESRLV